jgi:alpha-D-xyloside xylohydrolase
MMRALVMDFAKDKDVLDINDQYMFGKSLLVCPITKPMYVKKANGDKVNIPVEDFSTTKTKAVYLPKGSDWFDFWTGEKFSGGQSISKETPFDIIPLYVKAGSILPWGQKVQYATEKNWDNLEIRIYPGANGEFVLYEDENDNYNYEKGAYALISFKWNDSQKTLTIEDRKGEFPGMLKKRAFNIVMVGNKSGNGVESNTSSSKKITYAGKNVLTRF